MHCPLIYRDVILSDRVFDINTTHLLLFAFWSISGYQLGTLKTDDLLGQCSPYIYVYIQHVLNRGNVSNSNSGQYLCYKGGMSTTIINASVEFLFRMIDLLFRVSTLK